MRYTAPPVLRHKYPIAALFGNTPALPVGALVKPGNYTVRLTVNGKTYDLSGAALTQQLNLEKDQRELEKKSATDANAAGPAVAAFASLNRSLGSLESVVDGQDAAPTPAMDTAVKSSCADLATAAKQWNELMKTDLASLNGELVKQGLSAVTEVQVEVPVCSGAP
jgi:hypothetical protein